MERRYYAYMLIGWLAIIVISCAYNFYASKKENDKYLIGMARSFFNEVVVTREWNAMHGGVYVPVSKNNPPNLYLEDSLRDVETTGGVKLTKINPAYMTRQVAEINNKKYDVAFHITSLNPIRPQNQPDPWEKMTLETLEGTSFGIKHNDRDHSVSNHADHPELFELVKVGDTELYRYMAPLFVQPSCMACHEKQGYEIGDVRGGISVSIPAASYRGDLKAQLGRYLFFHLIFLIGGFLLIRLVYQKVSHYSIITERQNRALLRANATKDKLFSIIAHDLRSPFATITGITDLIGDSRRDYSPEEVMDMVGNVNFLSKNATVLLENLLNWSKAQSGSIRFEPESFLLEEIVLKVLKVANIQANAKQIKIHHQLTEDIFIYADRNMLTVILNNLLSNAIKFSYTEGNIYITEKISGDFVEITIKDEGVGIDPDKIDNLFTISKQSLQRGTANEKGSGLGLLLVKEFVDYHKGKLSVESEPDKGSTFTVSIPLANDTMLKESD